MPNTSCPQFFTKNQATPIPPPKIWRLRVYLPTKAMLWIPWWQRRINMNGIEKRMIKNLTQVPSHWEQPKLGIHFLFFIRTKLEEHQALKSFKIKEHCSYFSSSYFYLFWRFQKKTCVKIVLKLWITTCLNYLKIMLKCVKTLVKLW